MLVGSSPQWATHWLPCTLVLGLGIGLTLPVQSGAAVASLPPARYALGSAVNSSFRQLGAVLGISVFVALLRTPTPATALGDFHRIWWVFAAVGLASGAVQLIPRLRSTPAGEEPSTSTAMPLELRR
ncbi:hypothetical protein [Actinacidiphila oryziradicis]|uniref:hypothetical protein n=1 Tax=Actinacidiphila oryziradicis TaxID=2571141 RepID=UPI0023F03639|nr:hypothetical protein [Actinacidiphila oryziradicis]MCW2869739.1 hypothetical protein [Actinacidiphila oryziradicis]